MPAIQIKVKDETKYIYSVARTRVLETRLLDRAVLERMVEAESAEEVFRILNETAYSETLGLARDPSQFEEVLSAELRKTYEYVRGFSPDPAVLDVLSLRYDLHNLKVLLKEKYTGKEAAAGAFAGGGSLDIKKARSAVLSGELRSLPEDYARIASAAAAAVEETGDPQMIDLVVDGETFRLGLEIARSSGFDLLVEIWTVFIDVTNIKTLIRVNKLGKDRAFLKRCLIPGGSLKSERLLTLHGEPPSVVAEALRFTRYWRFAEGGLGEGFRFERMADNFVMGLLRTSKRKAFGPEPVIAYVLAKETEIRNLRIILTGKINGLPNEAIRERLRDAYV